jgi:hypothetical protein
MSQEIQVGRILIDSKRFKAPVFGLQSEPYVGNWSLVKDLDSVAMDHTLRADGWNFFFMAAAVKASVLGGIEAKNIGNAVGHIFTKVKKKEFNCLEITKIVAKSFMGIPYVTVSAHSRHIQRGYRIGGNGNQAEYTDKLERVGRSSSPKL